MTPTAHNNAHEADRYGDCPIADCYEAAVNLVRKQAGSTTRLVPRCRTHTSVYDHVALGPGPWPEPGIKSGIKLPPKSGR